MDRLCDHGRGFGLLLPSGLERPRVEASVPLRDRHDHHYRVSGLFQHGYRSRR